MPFDHKDCVIKCTLQNIKSVRCIFFDCNYIVDFLCAFLYNKKGRSCLYERKAVKVRKALLQKTKLRMEKACIKLIFINQRQFILLE